MRDLHFFGATGKGKGVALNINFTQKLFACGRHIYLMRTLTVLCALRVFLKQMGLALNVFPFFQRIYIYIYILSIKDKWKTPEKA